MWKRLVSGALICGLLQAGCQREADASGGETTDESTAAPYEFETLQGLAFPDDGVLDTIAELRVGDYFIYEYIKQRYDNGIAKNPESKARLSITVQSVDDAAYEFIWQLQMPKVNDSDFSYGARLARLGSVSNHVRVTRDFGEFSLVNADELYEVGLQTAAIMSEMNSYDEMSRSQVLKYFSNRDFSKAMYLKPIQIFFLCMGWEIEDGGEIIETVPLISEWGPPLETTVRSSLKRDPINGEMTWVYSTSIADDEMRTLLQSTSEHLLAISGVSAEGFDQPDATMSMTTNASAVFWPSSELPQRMSVTRQIELTENSAGSHERKESWSWRLLRYGQLRP